jgi:uncharacterized protein
MKFRRKIEAFSRKRLGDDPVAGFDHFKRVYRIAKKLGKGYDDEILHAACFLHDIVQKEPHHKLSAREAKRFLLKIGFPREKIHAVEEVILNHIARGKPKSKEGILLHDADLLDFLGAVGFARLSIAAFAWEEVSELSEVLSFIKKFRRRAYKNLILKKSKQTARVRVRAMDLFIKKLEKELSA